MNGEKERVRKVIFGKLRTLRRKMNDQGIPCSYARSALSHDTDEIGFKITFGTDGDMLPRLSLRTGTTVEEFDEASFEAGLARLREAFGPKPVC
jgi:hypothetical protein